MRCARTLRIITSMTTRMATIIGWIKVTANKGEGQLLLSDTQTKSTMITKQQKLSHMISTHGEWWWWWWTILREVGPLSHYATLGPSTHRRWWLTKSASGHTCSPAAGTWHLVPGSKQQFVNETYSISNHLQGNSSCTNKNSWQQYVLNKREFDWQIPCQSPFS